MGVSKTCGLIKSDNGDFRIHFSLIFRPYMNFIHKKFKIVISQSIFHNTCGSIFLTLIIVIEKLLLIRMVKIYSSVPNYYEKRVVSLIDRGLS